MAPWMADIEALHRRVDAEAQRLAEAHGSRLKCRRGCSDCCVDDIRVFGVEAELIRHHHADLLDEAPHPAGRCAFLDEDGGCRVYPQRPYVCRTQGLPLRWHEDDAEYRDICELNEPGEPALVLLEDAVCWTIGPAEAELAALEARRRGAWPAPSDRVRLRDLFGNEPCGR